jgi:hypothetical protein
MKDLWKGKDKQMTYKMVI